MRIHLVFINHKTHFPLIGDGRDQIDALTLWMKLYRRSLSTGSVTSSVVTIVTQAGFIAPMNFSPFRFCSFGNFRIFFIQPGFNRLWVLFIRFLQWLLGCKIPSLQVFTNSPDWHVYRPKLFDELLNCNACPQSKGQFQLIRTVVSHRFLQLFFLLCCQRTASALWATTLFDCKGFLATFLIKGPPCTTNGPANTSNRTDFAMPSALFSKPNNLITNFLLNISAEFSCVYFFHAQEITKYYRYVKYLFAELIISVWNEVSGPAAVAEPDDGQGKNSRCNGGQAGQLRPQHIQARAL